MTRSSCTSMIRASPATNEIRPTPHRLLVLAASRPTKLSGNLRSQFGSASLNRPSSAGTTLVTGTNHRQNVHERPGQPVVIGVDFLVHHEADRLDFHRAATSAGCDRGNAVPHTSELADRVRGDAPKPQPRQATTCRGRGDPSVGRGAGS